jgi:lysozyme
MTAIDQNEQAYTLARLTGDDVNADGEEGFRGYLYDDKSGKPVRAPVGKATIGYGCNVQAGWTREFAMRVVALKLADIFAVLSKTWWWSAVDPVRRSVFLDVAFNVGTEGLLHFVQTIANAAKGDWQGAHDELLDSDAARELPGRYKRLAQILLSGEL